MFNLLVYCAHNRHMINRLTVYYNVFNLWYFHFINIKHFIPLLLDAKSKIKEINYLLKIRWACSNFFLVLNSLDWFKSRPWGWQRHNAWVVQPWPRRRCQGCGVREAPGRCWPSARRAQQHDPGASRWIQLAWQPSVPWQPWNTNIFLSKIERKYATEIIQM